MRRPELTAFIYDRRGNILSVGKNSYVKTHPMQAKYARKVGSPSRIYLHAEIHAIARCQNIDKAYRMVVTRFGAKGEPRLAKPCKVCQQAISETPIKRIEHT